MSYEVLARKLRPAGFDALVGQDHVVRALRHALDHDRLHHAYLFTGTRGVGKTTIARILAKALNCETGVSSTPCETCSVCLEVRENRFIDLIEVDAASRTGIDDTRELLENAQYLPTRGRYKVYLIDEVHMLSNQAFNALLKTLEEPPEHVKFLLATTDPKKVPVTVLSRCLQFQLKNLSRHAMVEYIAGVLEAEGINFETEGLEVIARSAAGSMRDALSLTDQAISFGQGQVLNDDVVDMLGVVGRQEVTSVLNALAAGSAQDAMAVSAELAEKNADFADVLRSLLEVLHEQSVALAMHQTNADEIQFSAEELQLFYQIGLVGSRDLTLAPEPRSGFEMTLLRMLTFALDVNSAVPPRSSSSDQIEVLNPADTQSADGHTPAVQSSATQSPSAQSPALQPPTGHSPTAQAQNTQPDKAQNPPATASPPPLPTNESAQLWFSVVEALPLGGVTRMIADNSVPLVYALPKIELVLENSHDTLLNDAQEKQLARMLADHLGEVELTITLGALPAESPAQRREREARERQSQAEKVIEHDSTVANLIAEFGGRVDEIRPI